MVALLRYAFAWRGVIPLLRGGNTGMDASASMVAAALTFAAEHDTAAPLDIVGGKVRLPRRVFDIDQPSGLDALRTELASMLTATGCRVTVQASSAGANAEKAAARGGPQGVEARRLAGAQPPLDESFTPVKSRDEQPAAAPHALLLNRRLGRDAAAVEEETAEASVVRLEWAPNGGLEAMAEERPSAAVWAEEEEEQLEEAAVTEVAAAAAATCAAAAVRAAAEQVADPAAAAAEWAAVEVAAAAAAQAARTAVVQAAAARAARVREPEEEWEILEAAREEGELPGWEEEAEAFEGLLFRLRRILGVRRMPRLSESEGYAIL